ncbi:wobble nucleotide-excising tRNase [Chryseobacterium vietnamense]|uniref:Wobble nucleotide-excising tRNase n=1 Tax=Chryseobacterium vietnamense TaxID=866785 RepID=A0ACC6JAG5_9FLAO|nr:AAA family ATPase [Chryseobacterium vietnamense]MDR6459924.1 wobble nucleotide-excising tRNase [Chryseobacterium vietnamense]
MIESIVLKNVATYNTAGICIENIKKINFYYGANGSGKTTLSNFLQNPNNPKFNDCSIQWQNGQKLKTLVYNKDFREQNFGNGKLNGVFTIGQATKAEIEVINKKNEELQKIKEDGIKKRATLKIQNDKKNDLERNFKESIWKKIYKKYEKEFKEAFVGFISSKDKFNDKLLNEFSNNTSSLSDLEELKDRAKIIFNEIPQNIPLLSMPECDRILEIENHVIWNKIIVGKADVDIARLIQKFNINDWVNQGRSYIQDNDDTCPFCQKQTISEDFKRQLEFFFDKSYLQDLESLKKLKQEYEYLVQNIINQLDGIELNQKNLKSSKLDIDKFSAYVKTLVSQSVINVELLNNKSKEPSRKIEIVSLKEQLDLISELIRTTNSEIAKHNAIVLNFNTERKNLINSIWKFIIEEYRMDISSYNTQKIGLEKGIDALKTQVESKLNEYSALDSEIKTLSKDVTSIQPTINEINRLLKSYCFLNFEIVPTSEDGFYQIQREDGTIAEETLSEGEVTFITFLYYLQLAKGGTSQETVNEERILVIDDPISSLDSNVLFIVSTLIKDILKDIKSNIGNIKQIILLTHNVYFHKEVSFIDGRTKECKETNYWILRKNDKTSSIQSFGVKNPIQSSYTLLWQELKSEELSSSLSLQNIMRRIIENYFKLLGKFGDDDLIEKFESKEEQNICRSLISWINDGSHSINDDLFIELPDRTIENYKKVFKDIFIKTDHEGHYNMMFGIEEE